MLIQVELSDIADRNALLIRTIQYRMKKITMDIIRSFVFSSRFAKIANNATIAPRTSATYISMISPPLIL